MGVGAAGRRGGGGSEMKRLLYFLNITLHIQKHFKNATLDSMPVSSRRPNNSSQ